MDELIDSKYRLLKQIGQGVNGSVYAAEYQQLNKLVAVKLLSNPDNDPISIKRFKQEAHALSSCHHPGIVHIQSFGTTATGQLYYSMDFIDGESLDRILKRDGPLKPALFSEVFVQLLAALEHAHERGLIHRDIKPSNVMLVQEGEQRRAILIDFGLIRATASDQRLTKTAALMGTPLYMSPEQCAGKTVDARSDIYSLGCTMYEAATGAPPFRGDQFEVLLAHLNAKPARIPNEIKEFLERCLEKEPSNRFQTAGEALAALKRLKFDQETIFTYPNQDARGTLNAPVPKKIGRRHLIALAAVCAVTLSLLTLAQISTSNLKPNGIRPGSVEITPGRPEIRGLSLTELNRLRPTIDMTPDPYYRQAAYQALAILESQQRKPLEAINDFRHAIDILNSKNAYAGSADLTCALVLTAVGADVPFAVWKADVTRVLAREPGHLDPDRGAFLAMTIAQTGMHQIGSLPRKAIALWLQRAIDFENLDDEFKFLARGEPEIACIRFYADEPQQNEFAHAALKRFLNSSASEKQLDSGSFLTLLQFVLKHRQNFDVSLIEEMTHKLSQTDANEPLWLRIDKPIWCAHFYSVLNRTEMVKACLNKAKRIAHANNDLIQEATVLHGYMGLVPTTPREQIELAKQALELVNNAHPRPEVTSFATANGLLSDSYYRDHDYANMIKYRELAASASIDHANVAIPKSELWRSRMVPAIKTYVTGAWLLHVADQRDGENKFLKAAEKLLREIDSGASILERQEYASYAHWIELVKKGKMPDF